MVRFPDTKLEDGLRIKGIRLIAGVDEVGRGPLAGPVVAAAVIMPQELSAPWVSHVRDSKQLSPGRRHILNENILDAAISVGVAAMSNQVIDQVGIVRATNLAMEEALSCLDPRPDYALVDGRDHLQLGVPFETIVRGDETCFSIACASIVAKVARDNLMALLDQRLPGWGFAAHKGYPTLLHLRQLAALGPSSIHRYTYGPVAAYILENPA
ncbi:MAG: ribonuclease HII [Dehalococcoidia bacterium]|nr:ribonuclease HII [Dehalococcoidia bacterium]